MAPFGLERFRLRRENASFRLAQIRLGEIYRHDKVVDTLRAGLEGGVITHIDYFKQCRTERNHLDRRLGRLWRFAAKHRLPML